jgi:hypothetical protein
MHQSMYLLHKRLADNRACHMAAQTAHADCVPAASGRSAATGPVHNRTFFISDWLMGHATWLRRLCTLGASTERCGACSGTVARGDLPGLLKLAALGLGACTAAASGCVAPPSMSCSLHVAHETQQAGATTAGISGACWLARLRAGLLQRRQIKRHLRPFWSAAGCIVCAQRYILCTVRCTARTAAAAAAAVRNMWR